MLSEHGTAFSQSNQMLTLTRQQVRRVDQIAIEQYGIPGVVLMENAGRNATFDILQWFGVMIDKQIIILCGGGNNGGDGYVIARHLANLGASVHLYSIVDPAKLTGDAATNANITKAMQIPTTHVTDDGDLTAAAQQWQHAGLIVDAMLGTGFTGEVRPHMANVINQCNRIHATGVKVAAVDLPSGLDCDTGEPSNATIVADLTVTFVSLKQGFTNADSKRFTGEVRVADIGAPAAAVEQALNG